MADEATNPDNVETFVYTGEGGVVTHDVVCCRVHTSVTVIPRGAFQHRKNMEDVELCEGLLEIGERAFF